MADSLRWHRLSSDYYAEIWTYGQAVLDDPGQPAGRVLVREDGTAEAQAFVPAKDDRNSKIHQMVTAFARTEDLAKRWVEQQLEEAAE